MKKSFKSILLSKWTIIAAAVLVVAAAATVTALNWNNWFKKEETDTSVSASKDLFINVDRTDYIYQYGAEKTTRKPDKNDGYYHVSFVNVTQGRKVTRRVKNLKVLNQVDGNEIMGLKLDSNGVVVGVIPLEEMGETISVHRAYVTEDAKDGKVKLCTASDGDGIEYEFEIPDNIIKLDISGSSGEAGTRIDGNILEGDRITVLSNKDGKANYVFVDERTVVGTLYWLKTRMWDSKLGVSTRPRDNEGYWHFELAANGKLDTYKTKDAEIASLMDKNTAQCFGLTVEDGNIITDYFSYRTICKGGIFASYYTVTEIDGTNISVKKVSSGSNLGKTATGILTKKCYIYDVSGTPYTDYGAATELKVGDQIQGVYNARNKVCYLYVVGGRTVSPKSDVYWSTSRKWSNNTWTRKPEADGRYVFTLGIASKGVVEEFWTRDAALAKRIDQDYAAPCFGLKLNGHEILDVFNAKYVTGGISYASWYVIDSINGKTVTASKTTDGKTTTVSADLADDYIAINTKANCKKDTLHAGDKIHCLKDNMGNLKIVYIIEKANIAVKTGYCSHCNKTVPWYAFTGAASTKDGMHYVLTEDIKSGPQFNVGSAANTLFKYTAVDTVLDLAGHKYSAKMRAVAVQMHCKFTLIDSVGGGVITTENREYADMGFGVWLRNFAQFDMRGGTIDMTGFKNVALAGTSVSVSGGATFNMYDGATIKGGMSYYGKGTKSDGKVVTGGGAGGNIALNTSGKATDKATGKVVEYGGAVFNMYGGTVSGGYVCGTEDYVTTTTYGGNVYMTKNTAFNMYGGTVSGGTAVGTGGNIANNGGTFTISGGTVTGGKALKHRNKSGGWGDGHGGNFYNSAKINVNGGVIEKGFCDNGALGGGNFSSNTDNSIITMTDGIVKDGVSAVKGEGNIFLWNKAGSTFKMSGGTVTNTTAAQDGMFNGGVYVSNGKVEVSGTAKITGENDAILYLANSKPITATDLKDGALIVLDMKTSGVFAENAKAFKDNFKAAGADYGVDADGENLILYNTKEHIHCVCGKAVSKATDIGDHKTHEKVSYEPLTQAKINALGSKLPTSGNYYLAENINIMYQAANTGDINICFNGFTINSNTSGTSAGRPYLLGNTKPAAMDVAGTTEVSVTFTDCKSGGGIKKTDAKSSAYGAMLIINANHKVTLDIYGGTFDSSGVSSTNSGGLLAMAGSSVANMYGGTFIGASKAKAGGSVFISSKDVVFNIYEGEIKNGNANGTAATKNGVSYSKEIWGGNFYVQGTLNMYGGKISGGIAKGAGDYEEGFGGNIYLGATGKFNLKDGTVEGGSASDGGNIAAVGATAQVNVSGGTVKDGKAVRLANDNAISSNGWGGKGGNIFANTAKITVSGGKITGGSSNHNVQAGGNIAIREAAATLTVTGGEISGGIATARARAANIEIYNDATAKFSGGKVTGGVSLLKGKVELSGKANISGGSTNLFIASGCKITVGTLDSTANIGISMTAPGKFADAGKDYAANFTSDSSAYKVDVDGSGLKLAAN